ncbi:MAG: DUF4350 domain-containing protein [Pyrinomonadaceae bacterium]|nr:DUF4350 domain-containing protein [Pyrinomonadaceae bacterium]MDQ3255497.1 DUF4350 domain-containing protein [Acidobacteriota bacterium]
MNRRLPIFLSIALVLTLLVALNAASYVRIEREADSELKPDRSTLNAGTTGTRALYEFLQESGREVMRWRQPAGALFGEEGVKPVTLVIVGSLRRPPGEEEARELMSWVEGGGRLVIVDRMPDPQLLPQSGAWRVASEMVEYPRGDVRPDDAEAMMMGAEPLAPLQPTMLTRDVERVVRSRYAGRLFVYTEAEHSSDATNDAEKDSSSASEGTTGAEQSPSTPDARAASSESEAGGAVDDPAPLIDSEFSPAPVEHFADGREGEGALLLDYAYGEGRIVLLSDPYMISNAGLSRADNLQLAVNIVAGSGGLIAFDEYHHGHGASRNRTFAYFAGTPMLAFAGQAALILLAVLWTRARRFARPLPAPRVDRRSNLEFVASMAELQHRARAYDLALENIYGRTRRALARYAGTSNSAPTSDIAARIAGRSGKDAREIENLLHACEEVIAGLPVGDREAQSLAAGLRELERDLGIRMRAREVRQLSRH